MKLTAWPWTHGFLAFPNLLPWNIVMRRGNPVLSFWAHWRNGGIKDWTSAEQAGCSGPLEQWHVTFVKTLILCYAIFVEQKSIFRNRLIQVVHSQSFVCGISCPLLHDVLSPFCTPPQPLPFSCPLLSFYPPANQTLPSLPFFSFPSPWEVSCGAVQCQPPCQAQLQGGEYAKTCIGHHISPYIPPPHTT